MSTKIVAKVLSICVWNIKLIENKKEWMKTEEKFWIRTNSKVNAFITVRNMSFLSNIRVIECIEQWIIELQTSHSKSNNRRVFNNYCYFWYGFNNFNYW
jgi:hypothetical protein